MRTALLFICIGFLAAAAFAEDAWIQRRGKRGRASWYGETYRGRPMADGKPFDPEALTCASWYFELGTVLTVSSGDKMVTVTVTDRGPAPEEISRGIIIDLSRRAFELLAPLSTGLIPVRIRPAR